MGMLTRTANGLLLPQSSGVKRAAVIAGFYNTNDSKYPSTRSYWRNDEAQRKEPMLFFSLPQGHQLRTKCRDTVLDMNKSHITQAVYTHRPAQYPVMLQLTVSPAPLCLCLPATCQGRTNQRKPSINLTKSSQSDR